MACSFSDHLSVSVDLLRSILWLDSTGLKTSCYNDTLKTRILDYHVFSSSFTLLQMQRYCIRFAFEGGVKEYQYCSRSPFTLLISQVVYYIFAHWAINIDKLHPQQVVAISLKNFSENAYLHKQITKSWTLMNFTILSMHSTISFTFIQHSYAMPLTIYI